MQFKVDLVDGSSVQIHWVIELTPPAETSISSANRANEPERIEA